MEGAQVGRARRLEARQHLVLGGRVIGMRRGKGGLRQPVERPLPRVVERPQHAGLHLGLGLLDLGIGKGRALHLLGQRGEEKVAVARQRGPGDRGAVDVAHDRELRAHAVQPRRDGTLVVKGRAPVHHHRGELRHRRLPGGRVHPPGEQDAVHRHGGDGVIGQHVERDPVGKHAMERPLGEGRVGRSAPRGRAAGGGRFHRSARARLLLGLLRIHGRRDEPAHGRVIGHQVGGRDALHILARDPLHRVHVVHEPLPVRGSHGFAQAGGQLVGAVTPAHHRDLDLVLGPLELLRGDAILRDLVERRLHRVLHLLVADAGRDARVDQDGEGVPQRVIARARVGGEALLDQGLVEP